jgi:hypothetical protein
VLVAYLQGVWVGVSCPLDSEYYER